METTPLDERRVIQRSSIRLNNLLKRSDPFSESLMRTRFERSSHILTRADFLQVWNGLLFPFFIKHNDGSEEIVIASSPLDGVQLTKMFHLASPSKTYAIDAGDTMSDWDSLYTDPMNATRLAAHRRMPGWKVFEQYRELLLDLIKNAYKSAPSLYNSVTPTVRLVRKNRLTDFAWNYDELEMELEDNILFSMEQHNRNHFLYERNIFLSCLGPLYIAALSPDITSSWGSRRSYTKETQAPSPSSQNMGSTQALPLTLLKADTLLGSPIMEQLVEYTLGYNT